MAFGVPFGRPPDALGALAVVRRQPPGRLSIPAYAGWPAYMAGFFIAPSRQGAYDSLSND